jgi:hypothetical protein
MTPVVECCGLNPATTAAIPAAQAGAEFVWQKTINTIPHLGAEFALFQRLNSAPGQLGRCKIHFGCPPGTGSCSRFSTKAIEVSIIRNAKPSAVLIFAGSPNSGSAMSRPRELRAWRK